FGPRRLLPRPAAGPLLSPWRRRRRSRRSQIDLCRNPNRVLTDGAVPRCNELFGNDPRVALADDISPDRIGGFLRAAGASIHLASARAARRFAQRNHPVSNGFQWLDALGTVHRRLADSLDRY